MCSIIALLHKCWDALLLCSGSKMEKTEDMVVQLPKMKCLSCIDIQNVYLPPFYLSLTGLRVYGVMDVSWCICTCWQGYIYGAWRETQKLQVYQICCFNNASSGVKAIMFSLCIISWWYRPVLHRNTTSFLPVCVASLTFNICFFPLLLYDWLHNPLVRTSGYQRWKLWLLI